MGEKTAGVGPFQIPTAPGALTAVTQSASANTLGSAVSFGNAPSALFITGVYIGVATTQTPTYVQIQILAAASIVGSVLVPYGVSAATAASVLTGYRAIWPPIPIANAAALTVKSASSVASAVAWGVSLECVATTNVVDDGVAQSSNVTQWNSVAVATPATSGIPDVNVKNINNVAAATPGAAGGVLIAGSNAATTYATLTSTGAFTINGVSQVAQTGDSFARIGAAGAGLTAVTGVTLAASQHVIVDSGTVTTLSNLPAIPAGWLTATGIAASALNGKGDWNIGKTGYSLTQTFPTNFSAMALTVGGAVTAGTVSDKTGYSLAAAYDLAKTAAQAGDAMTLTVAYAAAKTAAQAGDAMALTAAERASVADALLSRNVSGGSSTGRLVKQALAVLRNRVEVVAGTLNVYDTDDTTILFTAAVTTAVGNPIASIDPT